MSLCTEDFEKNKAEFKKKYMKNQNAVYKYCSSWFVGIWSNWQIFCNKPGHANTNSNIESFNNVIKRDFTLRRKLNMKCTIAKLFEIIIFYSNRGPEFENAPKFSKKTKDLASSLTKSNFKMIRKNKIVYTAFSRL